MDLDTLSLEDLLHLRSVIDLKIRTHSQEINKRIVCRDVNKIGYCVSTYLHADLSFRITKLCVKIIETKSGERMLHPVQPPWYNKLYNQSYQEVPAGNPHDIECEENPWSEIHYTCKIPVYVYSRIHPLNGEAIMLDPYNEDVYISSERNNRDIYLSSILSHLKQ